jgi:hypothetical protein
LDKGDPAAFVNGDHSRIFGKLDNSVDTGTPIGSDNLVLTDPKPRILVDRAR